MKPSAGGLSGPRGVVQRLLGAYPYTLTTLDSASLIRSPFQNHRLVLYCTDGAKP